MTHSRWDETETETATLLDEVKITNSLDKPEIERLLDEAQPLVRTKRAEERRVAAVQILLKIRRVQVEAAKHAQAETAKRGERFSWELHLHPEIDLFFSRAANAIWSKPDPLAAMADFLGERGRAGRPLGRPTRSDREDVDLILRVRERMERTPELDERQAVQADAFDRLTKREHNSAKLTAKAYDRERKRYERAKKNPRVRGALAERALTGIEALSGLARATTIFALEAAGQQSTG